MDTSTAESVRAKADALVADLQRRYPGMSRGTATRCLLVATQVLRDRPAGQEAEDVFFDRIEEALDRGEAWAMEASIRLLAPGR